ncbi:hypothetical protein BD626DRAFT_495235 [Schizophyllum amplum]|uniref:NAD(P)-binding protein n=1 Tax=Schizophyllum amplum TaxID=97359 RepID=A0A550CG01_9AGAR|nr:hypothetical protein BD626DRAFT_495235 [Auriculariopsis ampla]
MSSSSTVYLVTGAGRGIGLGLASQLAARPDVVVFAGVRDFSRKGGLDALASAYPGRVHILKVVSADRQNNDEAVQEIKKVAGRLDVVIANAGVDVPKSSLDTSCEDMIHHLNVNTNGPLVLFQAAHELLRASKSPKFVAISSVMGSITIAPEFPTIQMAYGMSKAALNWVIRKLHQDNPDMTIFPINPGGVDTPGFADLLPQDPVLQQLLEHTPLISVEESVRGILEQVDGAKRETHGGRFVDYTGLGKLLW